MWVELRLDAVADRDDGLYVVLAQSVDLAQTETQRKVVIARLRGQRAVPEAAIDVGLTRLDAMVDARNARSAPAHRSPWAGS